MPDPRLTAAGDRARARGTHTGSPSTVRSRPGIRQNLDEFPARSTSGARGRQTGTPMSLLNAGRVGRPHGLDGSFHVTRPVAALLVLGGVVRMGDSVRAIVRRSGTPDRPILRLEGIDDRPAIEALRGAELLVARADAPPLPAGEYWAEDLEGCLVVTPDGGELGRVAAMRALPSCEVLEVGDLLVPMVADAVLEVSLPDRRIVVDPTFLGVGGDAAQG
jgi:16S rRNA processing protein RimM